jgi:hypothetical protein
LLLGSTLLLVGCSHHDRSGSKIGAVEARTAARLALRGRFAPPAGQQLFLARTGARRCNVFSGPGHWYHGTCQTSVEPAGRGSFRVTFFQDFGRNGSHTWVYKVSPGSRGLGAQRFWTVTELHDRGDVPVQLWF